MKIALCQINPTVGAINQNRIKIRDWYRQAREEGADLVVFPELAIMGYPPQDLLLRNKFVTKAHDALISLAKASTVPMIVGNAHLDDNRLFNSAFVCAKGQVLGQYSKKLLPTYDVFDEVRYFTPGKNNGVIQIELNDKKHKIGIQICEDLWDKNYTCNITDSLKENGAEFIINISASPYRAERLADRQALIINKVLETKLPFLYCNLIGAQDELIFDGQSLAYDATGQLIGQGQAFGEDLIMVDLDHPKPIVAKPNVREEKIYNALVLGVRDYFQKTGHSEAVLGLSGGIDSCLTACIAVDALGSENIHGVSMPSKYSSHHSRTDAEILANNLGIEYRTIPIETIVKQFGYLLTESFSGTETGVAEENIQARVRGSLLMALSNKFNWLVLSTGNKTELAMGYCTLYGDMNGGLSVISDLSKIDVYAISRWVNAQAGFDRIPINSIEKPPSAELRPDQVDPFDYDVVSPLVTAMIEEEKSPTELIEAGADPDLVSDISRRIRFNEYKRRQAAPGLRVTSKAFGIGRRVPIVNQYDELNND
jgi:NAD+ synthase (glutamine-hydrolysing)